jgi:hypothetical protein
LIAAAPELLAACRAIADNCACPHDGFTEFMVANASKELQAIRSAIAKAEGHR